MKVKKNFKENMQKYEINFLKKYQVLSYKSINYSSK